MKYRPYIFVTCLQIVSTFILLLYCPVQRTMPQKHKAHLKAIQWQVTKFERDLALKRKDIRETQKQLSLRFSMGSWLSLYNFWSATKTRFIKKSLWADSVISVKLKYEIFAVTPTRFPVSVLITRDSSQPASYRVEIYSDKEISVYQTIADENLRQLNANFIKSCTNLFKPYSGPKLTL